MDYWEKGYVKGIHHSHDLTDQHPGLNKYLDKVVRKSSNFPFCSSTHVTHANVMALCIGVISYDTDAQPHWGCASRLFYQQDSFIHFNGISIRLRLEFRESRSLYVDISSSSSSCRAGSTDIPDLLSPLLPIVHRLGQVFWTTSCIVT